MKRGLFITVEGTDGSGKTTQINLMEDYLKNRGYQIVLTREPGGTRISEEIRTMVLDNRNSDMGYITEMLLYASSRAQLVFQVIRPAIEAGKIVICDRFIDSSFVYQGFGRGIDFNIISAVNKAAIDGIEPDITFFFDLEPEIALKRRKEATTADRIENEEIDFHKRVYNGYMKLISMYPDRIRQIEASRNVEDIFSEVRNHLNVLIEKKGI